MVKSSKKSKLKKELDEHVKKVFYCPLCKGLLAYNGYEQRPDGSFITTWECNRGHIRHFKIVD